MLREGIPVFVHFEEIALVQPFLVFERFICVVIFVENQKEGLPPIKNDHLNLQEEIVPDDQLLHELVIKALEPGLEEQQQNRHTIQMSHLYPGAEQPIVQEIRDLSEQVLLD